MTKSVLTHQEDDGELSIFASGEVVVLACEHGHYWVLNAKQHSSDSIKPAVERSLSVKQSNSLIQAMRA